MPSAIGLRVSHLSLILAAHDAASSSARALRCGSIFHVQTSIGSNYRAELGCADVPYLGRCSSSALVGAGSLETFHVECGPIAAAPVRAMAPLAELLRASNEW